MKSKTTKKLKLGIFLFLLFTLPIGAIAQVTVYICGSATATLQPDFKTYTLVNGDKVVWNEKAPDGNTVATTYTFGTDPSVNFTTANNLNDGAYTYTVHVTPADETKCPGDVSTEYVVYKLPASVALASPVASFCSDAGTASSSVITATPSSSVADITPTYTWSATLNGSPVASIATLGSSSANVFTVKPDVTAGAYIFRVTASYDTGAVPVKAAGPCVIESTIPITVTSKPGKPTVTVL
ncbi:hypothetical protein ABDJ41_17550 [Pedobacter sp. ASV1-7]|uniref:hypothetical protein n=1 Tax=Pedobacter sp. ASV1-7 TaxID=3145237 RepID=UPI0032E8ED15